MAKAITYSKFGPPDVLTLTEVEPPAPAAGEVRVKVHATSVNPIDLKIRRGEMPFPVKFPAIPGLDIAGEVEQLGAEVTGVAVGDAVLGVATGGAYAQYAVTSVFTAKPSELSWELAGALPTVGEAAFRALKHLRLSSGETLLIHGAAGSVGAIATQLAWPAASTSSARSAKATMIRSAPSGLRQSATAQGWSSGFG